MILIIGGAYQDKLEFAKENLGITDADVYTCDSDTIDFSKRCIYQLEAFTAHHPDPVSYFKANRDVWQDSIFVLQDIFCGVVPLGADMRAWRDMTGRLCAYLSEEAASVTRMFCGLPQKLK